MVYIPPSANSPTEQEPRSGRGETKFPSKIYLVIQTILAIIGAGVLWAFAGVIALFGEGESDVELILFFWSLPATAVISLALTGWGIVTEQMRPVWTAAALPFVVVFSALVLLLVL